ncbi:hypothetical protein ACFQFS_10670, partial [Novosphingobium lubricantis]
LRRRRHAHVTPIGSVSVSFETDSYYVRPSGPLVFILRRTNPALATIDNVTFVTTEANIILRSSGVFAAEKCKYRAKDSVTVPG